MPDNRLERVEKAILHYPDPVVTAPILADSDDLADMNRRQVLDDLRLLERADTVESRSAGAKAVVWWHVDRVIPAPPKDPADHPDQAGLDETATSRAHNARDTETDHDLDRADQERSQLHAECNSDPVDGADRDAGDGLEFDEIDRALAGWDPGRSRQDRRERRQAGAAVLRWLRDDHNGTTEPKTVKRADVVAELSDQLSIDGQTDDTWWRKVARPALQHAADADLVDDSGRSYRWIGEETTVNVREADDR